MTIKTKKLLDEMTDALFEKKAVLLTGNTGVGKTYLAKKISEKLVERKYSCFPSSKDQTVNVEIISCHNSVTYEEIVGGITADTDSGKMFFEYKDKIFLETIIRAAVDYNEGKGTKYVLIMDDLQRNDVSTLIGDAVNAIGLEGEEEKLCLNSGMIVEIPPNFYIIGTYNAAETGAILLPSDLISKFYVREILSEIEYITEDLETENAVYYDQVRSLVLNYLDMQYRRSTYDQSRYFLGHGYFSGNNVSLKIRYQLIPILKQYISEAFDGIGTIKENKEADMNNDIIKYLLAKRTVNYFDLERKDITLPPWGMYLYPPILNNSLSTCDILRKVSMSTDLSKIGEPDEYLLVLTPSCDLVNEGIRNAKVEEVLCAKCFDKEVFSGDVRKAGKIESLLNSGVNKQWVALPAYKNICPSLTVDMKKLEIIPLSKVIMDIKELKENNTYLRICSVDSPFREQIIWNYMQTSCRPGVPDRNVTAWAKDIANIKK